MKNIKVLLLCCMLYLVTGCSIEYTLAFKDTRLSENVNIHITNSNMTENETKKFIEEHLYDEEGKSTLYDIKIKDNDIQLSQNYNVLTYQNSPLLSQCYTAYNFIEKDDYYDLTTSPTFNCNPFEYMDIDEIQIKIKTNHKVLSHNADSVEKDTYIWNITTQNAGNKPIQIRFSKNKKENIMGLIILGITAIIAIIILFLLWIQRKRNNKI